MKRLNNKGFTLIELLAVIVILAVVMGIAANSIISTMGKSRMGTINDSTLVIAKAMNQRIIEAQIGGNVNAVSLGGANKDFSSSGVYYLNSNALKEFGLTDTDYVPNTSNTKITAENADTYATDVNSSFVAFDSTNGVFTVCLVARSTGKVWVDSLKTTNATTKLTNAKSGVGFDVTFAKGVMFACSDGTKSKN